MNIGQRIFAGFGLIVALMIALGIYNLSNVTQMRDQGTSVIDSEFQARQLIREAGQAQRDMRVLKEEATVAVLLALAGHAKADPEVLQNQWEIAQKGVVSKLKEALDFTEQQIRTASDQSRRELWEEVHANIRQTSDSLEDIAAAVQAQFDVESSGNIAGIASHIDLVRQFREKFTAEARETESLILKLASSAKSDINDTHDEISHSAIIATFVIVLLAAGTALVIHYSITAPLKRFMAFVEKVGEGDLTQRIESTSKDELGMLAHYLNKMVDGLATATRQARGATELLNAATAELKAAAQQQSASTTEQNAAIQQITSTLDEIAQTGGQISQRAKSVANSAESTSSASRSGLNAAAETARAMASIREQAEAVASNIVALTEKTHSVGEIISSVNDIAERSDLLALNAAIEAAAAGEAGQSFAVVADEMKNLASQAKDATSQVRSILGDIQQGINSSVMQTEEAVKRSDAGERKARETEATIGKLAESIETSVATFEQIVASVGQQQIGIEQVAESI
ncbi:MAG: methyl-accepting chemotaxis protein, partial [Rhodospirillales bacterium]